MATADLGKELECSVCLNIYTDPVTLKCGHNFCRDCIGRVLDTQEWSGGYSCPDCRERFHNRPALRRNTTLRNIVENFLSSQPDQELSGVFCTYCIHTLVPAVKSCLHCEASLCDNHLRIHSKSPEHVLCDPTTSLENRKCSVHKKILEYYCTEDSSCICVSCGLAGEHRGHQVETLDEASEMKKKKLRNVLQKLMTEREEMEKRVQSLQEHRRKVQGKADDETERVTVLFRNLRRRLEDLEKRVLSEISGQAEWVYLSLSDRIQQLEIKKEELSRKMGDIEKLCNMTDPLTVLQESDTGDLCDTEDENDEDRERRDNLLHDGGDLDVAGISHTLNTGLSDIMSGVNVEKCTGTHVYPHSTTKGKGHINAEPSRRYPQPSPTIQSSRRYPQPSPTIQPSRRYPQPSPTIQHSHRQAGGPNIGAVQQTSGVTDILLDVSTAGNELHISNDRKTASWPSNQNHPETPARFQYPQVISSQRFSSGRHYWEVDVGGSEYCRVGVCYPSIDRRGDRSGIGDNKKSWGLERWGSNRYSVIHDRNKIRLPVGVSSNRVGIDLDYEAGLISFYDLFDPIQHLHTFTTTFNEPLHAGLCVWEGCIKIYLEGKSTQKLVTSQDGEYDWFNAWPTGGSSGQEHTDLFKKFWGMGLSYSS
ncbi:E3 ubiquitin/ISG15 ligase TRIM25-like [Rana temporaria]|uniref:E3 ubiquitin/ISG15 ligase TRIM25-like n=1 Tax=Rana temporaria TaxID=8407 RepID=UPI001AADAA50|nr:E3 ubiquitin/ISG15 ligase TRIM25-like [Rana temporaria]